MDGDQDIGLNERMSESLGGPARVGAELRDRRERLGWTTADVAAQLKIRLGFLQAIEDGDLAALPAPAYAAGFIRTYAEALGLDPNEILRRFRAEGMTRKATPVLAFPEPAPERGVQPGAVALLVGVIAIGAYAIWYYETAQIRRVANQVPPVPANLAALTLPKPPPMPRNPTTTTSSMPHSPAQASVPILPPPPPAPSAADIKAAALPPPAIEIKTAPLPPPAPAPVAQEAAPLLPLPPAPPPAEALAAARLAFMPLVPAADQAGVAPLARAPAERLHGRRHARPPAPAQTNNIVLIATSRTWVQVRDLHGKILFSRVMLPGESWPLPDQPGLTLTTGNAGGTALIRNGVPGPPLGPSGSVVHDVLVTPSGTIVPPLPSPVRRRSDRHRQTLESDPVDPFAISTKGDQ